MKDLLPKNKKALVGFGIFTVIFLLIVVGVILFIYIGLLSVFGFEYQSRMDVIKFLILLLIGGGIVEFIVFFIMSGIEIKGILTGKAADYCGMILELPGLFLVVHLLDEWMGKVTIPTGTELLFALSVFALEFIFKSKTEAPRES